MFKISPIMRALLTVPAAALYFSASAAFAAGSGMPWETPLQSVLQSIEGPVAKIVAVIIIIVTGLTLAFGDSSGGFKRLIQTSSVCRSPLPPPPSFSPSSASAAGPWSDAL
jgi:type IV secretion system protein VirB2